METTTTKTVISGDLSKLPIIDRLKYDKKYRNRALAMVGGVAAGLIAAESFNFIDLWEGNYLLEKEIEWGKDEPNGYNGLAYDQTYFSWFDFHNEGKSDKDALSDKTTDA